MGRPNPFGAGSVHQPDHRLLPFSVQARVALQQQRTGAGRLADLHLVLAPGEVDRPGAAGKGLADGGGVVSLLRVLPPLRVHVLAVLTEYHLAAAAENPARPGLQRPVQGHPAAVLQGERGALEPEGHLSRDLEFPVDPPDAGAKHEHHLPAPGVLLHGGGDGRGVEFLAGPSLFQKIDGWRLH